MKPYAIPHIRLSVVRDGSLSAEQTKIHNSSDTYALLSGYFDQHDREEFLIVLLDAKNQVTHIHTVSIGSLTLSIVHPREVFKAALLCNAAAIILAHNHPSGDPTPSVEDRNLTTRLVQGADILGIRILDHLIIGCGTGRYVSFADLGFLNL